ncbi:MAG: FAD-dependent oxidoreductase [Bacteroidota bacterium]
MRSIQPYMILGGIILLFSFFSCQNQRPYLQTQVLVVGGGASGTPAAIQAARMGAKVILIEETPWLGGMLTAAGVGATDGNHKLPSGLWGEFRQMLYDYYGGPDSVFTGWVSNTLFEPQIGNMMWTQLVEAEPNITRYHGYRITEVLKDGDKVTGAVFEGKDGEQLSISSDILIEATELGDVLPLAGAGFTTGTDTPEDPYNEHIQDLTYTAVVSFFPDSVDVRIPEPPGYDPAEFTCLCQEVCEDEEKKVPTCDFMLNYGEMPNGKFMLNWPNNGNDYYANIIPLSHGQRDSVYQLAKERSLNFIYFLQNEAGYTNLGLAKDVFPTEDLLPFIPYHREARRVEGLVQLRLEDLVDPYENTDRALYQQAIAVGDYPLDHHHDKNPNAPPESYPPIPSFSIPWGSLVPSGLNGMIVAEKSISVTHLVNGASRLQPAVMLIGQAAGAAAALCVDQGTEPSELAVSVLQSSLLEANCWLLPYLDTDPSEEDFAAIQRIGTTGIMRGHGVPYKWANQTWFYPDSAMRRDKAYLSILERAAPFLNASSPDLVLPTEELTASQLILDLNKLIQEDAPSMEIEAARTYLNNAIGEEYFSGDVPLEKPVTRRELASLLDALIRPFDQ